MIDGKFAGPRELYYDEAMTHPHRFFCYDINGKKTGMAIIWSRSYQIESVTEFNDNKKNGAEVFFKNAYVVSIVSYKDDIKDGPIEYYYESGLHNLRQEGQYLNNKQVGLWHAYDVDGNLIATNSYD